MAWVHHQILFISVLHLLTLSGRFRVGFGVGVGHDRALTVRDRYFHSEPL